MDGKKVLRSAQKKGTPEHLLNDCYVNTPGVCNDECADVLKMNALSTTHNILDGQIILKTLKNKSKTIHMPRYHNRGSVRKRAFVIWVNRPFKPVSLLWFKWVLLYTRVTVAHYWNRNVVVHQTEFYCTCRSISCSLYSIALSTYSFLLEKVRGMLFPPGMMGTIFPSALCPTKESRGIIWRTNTENIQC